MDIITLILVAMLIIFGVMCWKIYRTWKNVKAFFQGGQRSTVNQRNDNERKETVQNTNNMNDRKIFDDDEGEYVEFEEVKDDE